MNTVRDYDVKADGFEIVQEKMQKLAALALEMNLQYQPSFVLNFEYGDEKFLPSSTRRVAVSVNKKNRFISSP